MMGKHGIFDATFQQIILIAQTSAPHLVGPLRDIRSVHSKFFSELQTCASNVYKSCERTRSRNEGEIAALQKKHDERVEEVARLKLTAISLDTEAEDQVKLIEQLREQLKEAYERINVLAGGAGLTPQQRLKLNKQQMSSSPSVAPSGASSRVVASYSNHDGKQAGDDASTMSLGMTSPSQSTAGADGKGIFYNGSVTGMLAGISRSKNWVSIFRKAVQVGAENVSRN